MDLRLEYNRVQMGGQARILLFAASKENAERAARAAFDEIERLENVLSDWRPRSELSKLSASAGGPPIRVSPDLWRVLERAQKISKESDGAFDITVGPLTRLWRESRKTGQLPERKVLRAALERVGWEKLELDKNNKTARLEVPGMALDAGGIAKGYALDRALDVLKKHGVRSALLEMGGDLRAGRGSWTIEEQDRGITVLRERALSTSGSREQFVEIGGRRYAHIVDPRTGLGLTRFVQARVRALDGLTSDPLATALCVLGPGEAARSLCAGFSRVEPLFW
jgi:FAD:protein FMN transferase